MVGTLFFSHFFWYELDILELIENSLRFIIYASYALAFWYGVKLIMDDRDLCEEVFTKT